MTPSRREFVTDAEIAAGDQAGQSRRHLRAASDITDHLLGNGRKAHHRADQARDADGRID